MANAAQSNRAGTATERAYVEVDPALLAVIKSASVPVAVPKSVRPPSTIPGTMNPLRGLHVVYDLMARGIDAALDYRARYGDVYRLSLGPTPMIGVWDAAAVHQILKNDDKTWSAAMGWAKYAFEGLEQESGNVGGLLGADFEDHRAARKLVAPAFTTAAMDGYLAVASQHFASANAAWLSRGGVSFKAEVRALLSRVANDIFTGIQDTEQIARFERALSDFWTSQFAWARNRWLSPAFRRGIAGWNELGKNLLSLVPDRRVSGGNDLFSRLCVSTPPGEASDDALVRIVVSILGAAFDGTAAGLTSMGYLLAKHPAWQEKLREEAFALGDRPLDTATAREMKLTELVWKETLRLMPVGSFTPRRPLRTVDVAGHTVPAGALVLVATGAMGRHPAWWTAPSSFDPERFSPERAEDKKAAGIYQPFGGGAHMCIGMQLASMEVKAFWHDLLRRARIRLTNDYTAKHVHTPLGTVSGDVALTLEPIR